MKVSNEELKEFWVERFCAAHDKFLQEDPYDETNEERARNVADGALLMYTSFLSKQFGDKVFY